ncbi:MAG: penicillin acylase family protein [Pseudomonadota bacterium]
MLKKILVGYPLLGRLITFVILPSLFMITMVVIYFRQSLPESDNVQYLTTSFGNVHVSRSEGNLPVISGNSTASAYFGLGYVHAQDRMWQMETLRYLAKGRLAELKGQQALKSDIYMRTLGLETLARLQLNNLSITTQSYLNAYADGINKWLDSQKVLSIEYYVSGHTPEHWTTIDSLVVFKLFQYEYSYGLTSELKRSVAANIFGEQKAQALFSHSSQFTAEDTDGYINSATREFSEKMLLTTRMISDEFGFGEKILGDYAWAYIFNKDGKPEPIVGSVVNTQATLPAKFYIAEITAGDIKLSGATIPGLPIFLHGRNNEVAWSFVPVDEDVQDLYVENVSPKNDNAYRVADNWQSIKKRTEVFKVKADFPKVLRGEVDPVTWTVRETVNGPIVSDAVGNKGEVLSLKWVGMDTTDKSIESFFNLNFAHNKQDILTGFSSYTSPMINLVMADKHGNIGKKLFGKLPLRQTFGNRLPMAGWDSRYQWNGYRANDSISEVWAKPGEAVIAVAGIDATPAAEQAVLQMDKLVNESVSESATKDYKLANIPALDKSDADIALKIIDKIKSLTVSKNDALVSRLDNWDGTVDSRTINGTIFYTILRHIYEQLIVDELAPGGQGMPITPAVQKMLLDKVNPYFVYQVLVEKNAWCDDIRSVKIESCSDVITKSIQQSNNELTLLLGSSPEKWLWKNAGVLTYKHGSYGNSSEYSFLFNKSFALNNSNDLTASGLPGFSKDHGYVKSTDETYSQLINLGANTGLYFTSTGQSGNVFDKNYAKPSLLRIVFN